MTTPIIDWCEALAALWSDLTPPDRHDAPYHHLENREVKSWTVLDRGFLVALPARQGVEEAASRATSLVEWSVPIRYHVTRTGRGFFDFARAVALEQSQLARAAEAVTSWPAGVSEVFLQPVDEPEETADGAIITFTFSVLTEDS